MTQPGKVLIIFVKNPVLGQVKTRLAKSIGPHRALEVYIQLLLHTHEVTAQLMGADRFVYYADNISRGDIWEDRLYKKQVQQGDDLGERMLKAFAKRFEEGASKVIIIGSDCPEIQPEHLQSAFQCLDTADVVLGPAKDGGYYLLGMKNLHQEFFQNISWSTSEVLAQTWQKVKELGLSGSLLEPLSDLDEIEDYEQVKEKLGKHSIGNSTSFS